MAFLGRCIDALRCLRPEMADGPTGTPETARSVCSYCGVGCGLILEIGRDPSTGARSVGKVRGDAQHPANWGRLCTKGATSAELAVAPGRADRALIRPDR